MPAIVPIRPISRQSGIAVPDLVNAAEWVDCLVLGSGSASSYTLPIDANGNKGTILGITATSGPLWLNADGSASIPSSSNLSGTSPSLLRTGEGFSYLFVVADSTETLSFISPVSNTVVIEVWK